MTSANNKPVLATAAMRFRQGKLNTAGPSLGHIDVRFPADMAIVDDTCGTVLLLEDEASLREPLAHLLRLRRYNVIEVDTVDAALAAIRTERPDAAIVDLHVKDQSGRDVIVRMPSRAPVIIFSGMGAASGDLARLRPRTRLVEKPASLTWVIDSLDEMLQRTREFA